MIPRPRGCSSKSRDRITGKKAVDSTTMTVQKLAATNRGTFRNLLSSARSWLPLRRSKQADLNDVAVGNVRLLFGDLVPSQQCLVHGVDLIVVGARRAITGSWHRKKN
jgi:hypothetical protein